MTVKDLMSTFWSFATSQNHENWKIVISARGGKTLCDMDATCDYKWQDYEDRVVVKWYLSKKATIFIVVEPVTLTETVAHHQKEAANKALTFYEEMWSRLPACSSKEALWDRMQDLKAYLAAVKTIEDLEAKKLF